MSDKKKRHLIWSEVGGGGAEYGYYNIKAKIGIVKEVFDSIILDL